MQENLGIPKTLGFLGIVDSSEGDKEKMKFPGSPPVRRGRDNQQENQREIPGFPPKFRHTAGQWRCDPGDLGLSTAVSSERSIAVLDSLINRHRSM